MASIEEINTDDSISYHVENEQEEKVRPTIAKEETKTVGKLRILVFAALFITGVSLSIGVFQYVRWDEQEDFEVQFDAHARKIIDSFNAQLSQKLGVMDGFSKSITTYALENNLLFPQVTLPNFEMRGMNVRQQVGALRVDWFPFVTDEIRDDWEAYAVEHQSWLFPAVEREKNFRLKQDERFEFEDEGGIPGIGDPVVPPVDTQQNATPAVLGTSTDAFSPFIYGKPNGVYEVETEGPFLVLWQFSPVTPTRGSLNFNLLTARSGPTFRSVLESEQAVLGNALALTDPEDPASGTHAGIYAKSLDIGQYRHSLDELTGDPTSNLIYPVFSSFDENRTFVGVVRAALYWRFYFVSILPANARGLICVIENTRNQTFTYQIDGPDVTFLGPGDRHHPDFDNLYLEEHLIDMLKEDEGPATTGFEQAELNGEFCSYTLRMYPSHEMRDDYITRNPYLFSFLVAISFFFPSLVFLVYNLVVEKRQTVVMDQAVASGTIVSSLFPENVAQRLMMENKERSSALLNRFEGINGEYGDVVQASEPIAERFVASTIMFGDLAGFTHWSASRTPDQVFVLLESVYRAFDELAMRRRVFKVVSSFRQRTNQSQAEFYCPNRKRLVIAMWQSLACPPRKPTML